MEQHPKILLDKIEAVLNNPDGKVSELGEKGRVLLLRALTAMRVHQTTDDDFDNLPQEVKEYILKGEETLEALDAMEARVRALDAEVYAAFMSDNIINDARNQMRDIINSVKVTGTIPKYHWGVLLTKYLEKASRNALTKIPVEEVNVRKVEALFKLACPDLIPFGLNLLKKNPRDVEGDITREVDTRLPPDPDASIEKVLTWGVKLVRGNTLTYAKVVCGDWARS